MPDGKDTRNDFLHVKKRRNVKKIKKLKAVTGADAFAI
jgi:hypothetical protein